MIIICGFHICTEADISMITLGYLDDVIFHKRVERENLMTKERENSNLTFLIFIEILSFIIIYILIVYFIANSRDMKNLVYIGYINISVNNLCYLEVEKDV